MQSQSSRVLDALRSGEQLTAKQIAARFQARNPYEAIRQLRIQGYAVYANQRTNSKGDTKTFYRLGQPTRSMVAAAYSVMGA